MNEIKRIITKKEKKIKILDIGIIIICLIYTTILQNILFSDAFMIFKIMINTFSIIPQLLTATSNISALLSVILIIVAIIAINIILLTIFTFPINVICLAIRNAIKKKILQNTKFESIEGYEYFRENLGNISPSTISLIMDLKLEYKKDIVATIMKLNMNKNIEFYEDKIILKNSNTESLNKSEIEILKKIQAENEITVKDLINTFNRKSWKEICIEEAESRGYIVNKNKKMYIIIKTIILIMIWIGCINAFNTESITEKSFNEKYNYEEMSDEEFLQKLSDKEFEPMLIELNKLVIKLIAGIGIFVLPIYIFTYVVSYKAGKVKIARTKKGKILMEQIYGMKNYIHEFSYLNEAIKEHIITWDYFLVYAIVLEENSKILEDVFKYKNVTIPFFANITK